MIRASCMPLLSTKVFFFFKKVLSTKVRKGFCPLCDLYFLFLFNVEINIILLNKCLTSLRGVSAFDT